MIWLHNNNGHKSTQTVLQDYHTGYSKTGSSIILVWSITSLAQNQMLLLGMTFCRTSFVISIGYITTGTTVIWQRKIQKTYYSWNNYVIWQGKNTDGKLVEILFVFTVDNYMISHHKLCTQMWLSLLAS